MFSLEEIEAMKAARAGQSITDVANTNINQYVDRGPSDISIRSNKVSRPNIAGSGNFVTRVNTKAYNAQHEERRQAEVKAQQEYVSPAQAQEKQIQYLTRAVQKLQKELKSLKSNDC